MSYSFDPPSLVTHVDPDILLAKIRQFGWNATSFQLTRPGFNHWRGSNGAVVSYVDTGACWVVGGAPLCDVEKIRTTVDEFIEHARSARRRVVFAAVEQRFLDACPRLTSTCIGSQPVWNPQSWTSIVAGSRSLRSQVRRPRSKGVTTRQVDASELDQTPRLRGKIDDLITRWLESRGAARLGFLVDVRVDGHERERRYVVAERGGEIAGVCMASPVYARAGWYLENILRAPDAPNGTSELLVDTMMRTIAAEGASYSTLGLAPLHGAVPGWLSRTRVLAYGLYDFDGLAAFKSKLAPERWDPLFIAYPTSRTPLGALYDIGRALTGESLVSYLIRTLAHRRNVAKKAKAALTSPSPFSG